MIPNNRGKCSTDDPPYYVQHHYYFLQMYHFDVWQGQSPDVYLNLPFFLPDDNRMLKQNKKCRIKAVNH